MKRMTIVAAFSILSALSVTAFAQGKGGGKAKPAAAAATAAPDPKNAKTYDFSGDQIDGELVKPDGEFLDTRKFATHTNLIKLRTDFIKEIVKSAEDL